MKINNIKATDVINWRKVSTALSGNPEGVRSTYSGKKYKDEVNELVNFAEKWLERHSKAGSAGQKQNGQNVSKAKRTVCHSCGSVWHTEYESTDTCFFCGADMAN
jgi:hypothetical protein